MKKIIEVFSYKFNKIFDSFLNAPNYEESSYEEKLELLDDFLKQFENLKKEVKEAKENSSKTALEDKIGAFNRVLDILINGIDDTKSFIKITTGFFKPEEDNDESTIEEEVEFERIMEKLEKNGDLLEEALEELEE